MSEQHIDYDRLAEAVARKMAARNPPALSMSTKMGIAIGSFAASTAFLVGAVPVIGHGCRAAGDVVRGIGYGYTAKSEQLKIEEKQAQERAQEQAINMATV